MTVQDLRNVAPYLARFMAMLRIEQDTHDRYVFEVEVLDDGMTEEDQQLLR